MTARACKAMPACGISITLIWYTDSYPVVRSSSVWRRDGTELFYLAPNQTLMAVGVKSNPTTLEVSPPKALFATRIKWMEIQAVAHHYAAAPDGQRFLISSATDEARSVPVTIVLNWSAALQK